MTAQTQKRTFQESKLNPHVQFIRYMSFVWEKDGILAADTKPQLAEIKQMTVCVHATQTFRVN